VTAKGSTAPGKVRAPLVTLGIVTLAAAALAAPDLFELSRQGLARGELWRLWTAHLAHYSIAHFAVDAGTLLLLGFLYEDRLGSGRWALLLSTAATAISLVFLVADPSLSSYRGLSGLDCTAFVAGLVVESRDRRPVALFWGIAFGAKVLYEQLTGTFLFPSAGLGEMGLPVLSAHTTGALAGLAAILALRPQGIRPGSRTPEPTRFEAESPKS